MARLGPGAYRNDYIEHYVHSFIVTSDIIACKYAFRLLMHLGYKIELDRKQENRVRIASYVGAAHALARFARRVSENGVSAG